MSALKIATANPSTAQTNTNLIAARSGRYVEILAVYVSSDTAQTVSLRNATGHEDIWEQFVAANGGSVVSSNYAIAVSSIGEGVDYNTSAASNVWLTVVYKYNGE